MSEGVFSDVEQQQLRGSFSQLKERGMTIEEGAELVRDYHKLPAEFVPRIIDFWRKMEEEISESFYIHKLIFIFRSKSTS